MNTTFTQTKLAETLGKTEKTIRNHTALVERTYGLTATVKEGRTKVYTDYGAALVALSVQGLIRHGVKVTDELIEQTLTDLYETATDTDPSEAEVCQGELVVFDESFNETLTIQPINIDLTGLDAVSEALRAQAEAYQAKAVELRLQSAQMMEQAVIAKEKQVRAKLRAEAELEAAQAVHDETLKKLKDLSSMG